MSLLAYFMAHAPAEPQPWFSPRASVNLTRGTAEWDDEVKKQKYIQWPEAWAREQIAILDNLI